MKKLLTMVLRGLLALVEGKKNTKEVKKVYVEPQRPVTKLSFSDKPDYDKMSWKEVPKDIVDNMLAEIQASIYSLGYKAIPEVLEAYRHEMVQHFVTMQLISLGQYSPEEDNLEALTKAELIKMACELNQLQFQQRMVAQGKAGITKKQVEILEKNGVARDKMPKDRFSASEMIDAILKAKGIDTSKPYDNSVSEGQRKAIESLSAKLGLQAKDINVANKKEASVLIEQLTKDANEKFGNQPASTEQVEYVAKLFKLLNKRMTAKKKCEYGAMTNNEISKAIGELKTQYDTVHPELSEGQKNYIVSLCSTLNIPYDITLIERMTKVEATKKIDELNRKYLFMVTRKTNPSLSMQDITEMSSNGVKSLLEAHKLETRTKMLTRDIACDRAI